MFQEGALNLSENFHAEAIFNIFTHKSSFLSQERVYTLYQGLSILKKDCENYLLMIMI